MPSAMPYSSGSAPAITPPSVGVVAAFHTASARPARSIAICAFTECTDGSDSS